MEPVQAYYRNSKISLRENQILEFKGHRQFSFDDVNYEAMASRDGIISKRHISSAACGMINSHRGGIILMGVLDSGEVQGFHMSPYQQHHFLLAVRDAFERFSPPVPEDFYKIEFRPVVEEGDKILRLPPKAVMSKDIDPDQPHLLRTSRYCWCDNASKASMLHGLLYPFWVIELHISPLDETDPRIKSFFETSQWSNKDKMFAAEDGKVYIRGSATTNCVDLS